jgi:hypothetical protein
MKSISSKIADKQIALLTLLSADHEDIIAIQYHIHKGVGNQ